MKVYLEFFKKSFLQQFIYRFYALFGIFEEILYTFIIINVWIALLANKSVDTITLNDMINYVIANLLIITLSYSGASTVLAQKVRDGSIALELIKPINIKLYLLSDDIGKNIFRLIFRYIPVFIIFFLTLKFTLPGFTLNSLLFIISLINAVYLIFLIHYSLGLLSFWFKTDYYVKWMLKALFGLFSGRFVPLWFYPKIIYNISLALPFRLTVFEPISIFLNKKNTTEALLIILYQFIWIGVFQILEHIIWKKAQKELTVHGG